VSGGAGRGEGAREGEEDNALAGEEVRRRRVNPVERIRVGGVDALTSLPGAVGLGKWKMKWKLKEKIMVVWVEGWSGKGLVR